MISFISPCVLPIVPPYLAYLAGIGAHQEGIAPQSRPLLRAAAAFVAGFSTVFILLGLTAFALGQLLLGYLDYLAILAGAVIIVMGLHFLGVLKIALFYRQIRFQPAGKTRGSLNSYIMGMAFSFGWTPCIGPVLGAVLAVAAVEETALKGALLLALYALGLGVPFLIAAAFAERFTHWTTWFRRHSRLIEKTMGVLLIITGILFITGSIQYFALWLVELFPILLRIG